MPQTNPVFLYSILRRDPEYVIAGEREVYHLDARGGKKSIQVFGLRYYFCHSSIVSFSQFPPHGVETVWPDPVSQHYTCSLPYLVVSLHYAETIPYIGPLLRDSGPRRDNH